MEHKNNESCLMNTNKYDNVKYINQCNTPKYSIIRQYNKMNKKSREIKNKGDKGDKGDRGDFGLSNTLIMISIISTPVIAISTSYQEIAYFPWIHSEYQFLIGKVIFDVKIADINLGIRLHDVTHTVILGQLTNINMSGIYNFSFVKPTSNSRLRIEIMKGNIGKINPIIYSVNINFYGS